MIEKKEDALVFAFPEVHRDARCTVAFQRTLRLPDGSGDQPLPPGLGRFRLSDAPSCRGSLPGHQLQDGILFPMYQSEALLVVFIGWYPCAIKVTSRGRNVLTGRMSVDDRLWRPADYVTFPRHPWMEWFCLGRSEARQFVADTLDNNGEKAALSDMTISMHPMKKTDFEAYREERAAAVSAGCKRGDGGAINRSSWEITAGASCTVYPVNTSVFRSITGRNPEGTPPGREDYRLAGIPWRETYGADEKYLSVSDAAAVC